MTCIQGRPGRAWMRARARPAGLRPRGRHRAGNRRLMLLDATSGTQPRTRPRPPAGRPGERSPARSGPAGGGRPRWWYPVGMTAVTQLLDAAAPATRGPPPTCCRSCTTSCAARRRPLAAESRARPCRPPPSSTRRTSGSSARRRAAGGRPRALLRRRRRGHAPHPGRRRPQQGPGQAGRRARPRRARRRRRTRADRRGRRCWPWTTALDALAREDPAKAELVKLRYFAGLTLEQAAACQGISPATAKRRWALARAWLFDAISTNPQDP
jgi:hypothetical protein